jgi:hypothetical protein
MKGMLLAFFGAILPFRKMRLAFVAKAVPVIIQDVGPQRDLN